LNNSGMDPVVSDPQPREARMLAAIVFTDVVGFSKLASQNEGRVYVALQRDMGVMTNLCRAHGGQVLNTMGDGMLLCFASAVDAMSCATEIQQTLYNQSHTLPATEVLHHRIGVHLGDVIMNGDNVFGDGVNVAARLQALAKPDAVCFSHTVYEIVKNKLRIDAKYLGPRQLKNLGEPVRVWQVAPLGEGQTRLGGDDSSPVLPIAEAPEGAKGFKGLLMLLGSIVLVGGLGFAFTRLKPSEHTLPTHTARSDRRDAQQKPNKDSDAGTPTVAPTVDASTVTKAIDQYKAAYQFEQIVSEIDRNGSIVPGLRDKRATYEDLAKMMVFLQAQLSRTNSSTTIPVKLENGEEGNVYYSAGQLYFMSPTNGTQSAPWPPSRPSDLKAILTSLTLNTVDNSTAPAELPHWIELFSSEYPAVVATPGT